MRTLFIVATPIGNLDDITLRALRVLNEVALVAAEDTRTTRALLTHHGIRARLVSYNEHNMRARTPQLLAALQEGDIALVSEAGTPGVSDPGHQLIVAALEAGCEVVPVPGPSAVIAALTASGLSMREFTFGGFLPRRPGERRRALSALAREPRTLVFFEAPHRLRQALEDIRATLGDRRIAACRELTKAFEEVFRGTVSEAIEHFGEPRGEFTLVVEGATGIEEAAPEDEIRAEIARLRASGESAKDSVASVAAAYGVPKRRAYRLWLDASNPPPTRKGRRPSAR